MNNEELAGLLEIAATEERFYVDQHQKRIQFFVVLNSTLLVGCVAALSRAKDFDVWPLFLIPLLIAAASQYAKAGVRSLYVRLLETIVQRAKIEQALGMTNTEFAHAERAYWKDEPLINTRHLEARHAFEQSSDFIEAHKSLGYQRVVNRLFLLFQFMSFGLLCAVLALSPAVSSQLMSAVGAQ